MDVVVFRRVVEALPSDVVVVVVVSSKYVVVEALSLSSFSCHVSCLPAAVVVGAMVVAGAMVVLVAPDMVVAVPVVVVVVVAVVVVLSVVVVVVDVVAVEVVVLEACNRRTGSPEVTAPCVLLPMNRRLETL